MSIKLNDIPTFPTVYSAASPLVKHHLYEDLPREPNTAFIRVLHLACESKDPDAPLCGVLRHVDLRTCPKFTALSYVWGPYAPEVDTIDCNGQTYPITRNCCAALRSIRALYGPTTIWVDAICINQQNEAEKISQIQLMEEIYT